MNKNSGKSKKNFLMPAFMVKKKETDRPTRLELVSQQADVLLKLKKN